MNKTILVSRRIWHSGLLKNSGVYTIASFANAGIPFLLMLLLTNRLSRADFGIITMFITVQAFLYPIVGFNFEGAVARKFYSRDTDLSVYIGNCLMLFGGTTILSLGLFFGFSHLIWRLTEIPQNWVVIIPLICAAQFLCSLVLALWQIREKPVKYAAEVEEPYGFFSSFGSCDPQEQQTNYCS